jgi:endonuclease-3 related protein
MGKIRAIYQKLYSSFGPQGWWPTTLENELHPKHHGKAPKNDKERFEIIIGAILTQNTNWKNVEKAILNLNKNQLLNINKIKKINKNKLAALIRPSGYFNQKAERLKLIADFYSKNKNPTREELLAVKGIGPETADSILLYALGKTSFVVDAYTKRIFGRLGFKEKTYDEFQDMFHKNLPKKQKLFNEYHALLVELGKNHCKTKPVCKDCPLKKLCSHS